VAGRKAVSPDGAREVHVVLDREGPTRERTAANAGVDVACLKGGLVFTDVDAGAQGRIERADRAEPLVDVCGRVGTGGMGTRLCHIELAFGICRRPEVTKNDTGTNRVDFHDASSAGDCQKSHPRYRPFGGCGSQEVWVTVAPPEEVDCKCR
jgi:hypothetical protein